MKIINIYMYIFRYIKKERMIPPHSKYPLICGIINYNFI